MPFGPLIVEEATTGAFMGEVGLYHFKRDITPPIDDVPEAGWAVLPAMQGRGYATEAMRGLLQWADVRLAAPRIVADHPRRKHHLRFASLRRSAFGNTIG